MIKEFANPYYFFQNELERIRDGGMASAIKVRALQTDGSSTRIGFVNRMQIIKFGNIPSNCCALISGDERWVNACGLYEKSLVESALAKGNIKPFEEYTIDQKFLHEIDETQIDRIKSMCDNEAQVHFQMKANKYIGEGDKSQVIDALRSGADVNYQSYLKGVWDTPLVRAMGADYVFEDTCFTRTAVLEALIDHGANVNLQGPCGYSPLMLASFIPYLHSIIPLLIQAGARVNDQDDLGDTAFMQAAGCTSSEALKLLYDAGADPFMKNNRRKTAMHAAIGAGSVANIGILKTLIDGTKLNNAINSTPRQETMMGLELAGALSKRTHRNVF